MTPASLVPPRMFVRDNCETLIDGTNDSAADDEPTERWLSAPAAMATPTWPLTTPDSMYSARVVPYCIVVHIEPL